MEKQPRLNEHCRHARGYTPKDNGTWGWLSLSKISTANKTIIVLSSPINWISFTERISRFFYQNLFICLRPAHLTYMNKKTSEISAKWLLSGCVAEVLLCDSALWMPPPFNGKRIPHCNRWSREILLQVTNWAAEIPLYSCLFLLLWAQQVHWGFLSSGTIISTGGTTWCWKTGGSSMLLINMKPSCKIRPVFLFARV